MEQTSYFFPIPEIEEIIFSYLDPITDFKQLVLVNKYYHSIISNQYNELKNYFKNEKYNHFFGFRIISKIDKMFIKACRYGSLNVVKYIYSKYKNIIDIHMDDEYAFQNGCINGNLEIVKYLLSLDDKIDIHANNDLAFKWSCLNGHLEISKFIFSLDNKINHEVINNVLRSAVHRGDSHIIEWVRSLHNK